MKKKNFKELLKSIDQAREIHKGKSKPSHYCYTPMQEYPKHINRKEQKAAAGNYGKPKDTDHKRGKKTIPYPDKPPKSKRKKKEKRKYFSPLSLCPFCGYELPEIGKKRFFIFDYYADKCDSCGARKVDEPCPSCKSGDNIWKNNKDIYCHIGYFNCGFRGKKIQQKEKKDGNNSSVKI